MICKECKKTMPDEAVFCPNCGALVETGNFEAAGLLTKDYNEAEGTSILDETVYESSASETVEEPAFVNNTPPVYENSGYVNNNSNSPYNQPVNPSNQFVNNKMGYKEFYEKCASKKTKNNNNALGIICIITVVASLGLLTVGNIFSIIDIVFYLIFGILILKKKSWEYTLAVTVYGGAFTLIGMIASGAPAGIVAFIVGILATKSLKKLNEAYKTYLSTDQLPTTQI